MEANPVGSSLGSVASHTEVFALSERPGVAVLDALASVRAHALDVPIIIKNSVLNFLSAGGSLCPGCTRGRFPSTAGSPHESTSDAKGTPAPGMHRMLCTRQEFA